MYEIKGTGWCPYCQEAKDLLNSLNKEVVFVDLDEVPEKALEMIEQGMKTIPQIYHNGNRVGGYEDLKQYIEALCD